MRAILKHKLLVAGAALVAAASAGGAYAASQSGSNPRKAFLNDVAKRLNVTPSQLDSAIKAAFLDRLDAAVKAGVLTQAEANQIKQRIEQGGELPFFGGRHGLFFGPRGHFDGPGGGSHGFFGHPGGMGPGGPLGAAAQYLGLSDAQLFSEVRSGKSLAQIAQARGKSVSGLEHAMIGAATSRLDQLVAAGQITKAQEQRLVSRLSTHIGRLVNRAGLRRPPIGGRAPDDGPLPAPPLNGPPAGAPGGDMSLGGPPPAA